MSKFKPGDRVNIKPGTSGSKWFKHGLNNLIVHDVSDNTMQVWETDMWTSWYIKCSDAELVNITARVDLSQQIIKQLGLEGSEAVEELAEVMKEFNVSRAKVKE